MFGYFHAAMLSHSGDNPKSYSRSGLGGRANSMSGERDAFYGLAGRNGSAITFVNNGMQRMVSGISTEKKMRALEELARW